MRDRIFYGICFGFIFGVLLSSFISIDFYFNLLGLTIFSAVFLFFVFISKSKWGIILSIFFLFLSLGILRFDLSDKANPEYLENKVGSSIIFKGEIIDEPSLKEDGQKFTVEIIQGPPLDKVKVLINTNSGVEYQYGDLVDVSGRLEKPENFLTDQGKTFDYINYLRKDGVLYTMSYPRVEVLSRGNGNFILNFLFSIKNKFLEKLDLVIPEPESTLLGGILLGEKASFSPEFRQNFVNTGTIHIVALSGYNITIVAEWFMKVFSFMSPVFSIWSGIVAIILFIFMTGSSSTAIRAGIMAVLALYARQSGREYDVARILVLTAATMILFNPFVLVYDVSFQLSFIATIALIFFTPKIEKYFYFVPERFGLRDIVAVTFAVYIVVLPFILYKMGNLSLVALPTNILILPLIPFTMLFGFITGIFGLISHLVSVPFGYVSQYLLQYELSVVNFFSNIPFSSITIPDFPLMVTILIYMYFGYMLFGRSIKEFFTRELV